MLDFIRSLLKAISLFFPGILIVLIFVLGFTGIEQGRDLIVSTVESRKTMGISLVAVGFLAMITWYLSRWISTHKTKGKSLNKTEDRFHRFIPRFLGLSCYGAFQLAILNLSVFPFTFIQAFGLVTIANGIFLLLGWWWMKRKTPPFEKRPFVTFLFAVFVLFGVIYFYDLFFLDEADYKEYIKGRLSILLIVQVIMGLLFFNFVRVLRKSLTAKKVTNQFQSEYKFSIKDPLINFHLTFQNMVLVGVVIYLMCIISPWGSEFVGAFNFVVVALAIMAGIGYILTYYSIKLNTNVHVIVLGLIFLLGFFIDPYKVNTIKTDTPRFGERVTMEEYFDSWFEKNQSKLKDTASTKRIPVYVSLADGGASRSGYWVAKALGKLEDTLKISENLFCISGASGGTVGNITYYDLLMNKVDTAHNAAEAFLSRDFLTFTLSRLLSPFYFLSDRGNALEKSFHYAENRMKSPFSDYILTKDSEGQIPSLPILYVNTTRMQDSRPSVVSNISFKSSQLNNRVDVLSLLDHLNRDIRLSSVAILSSRFPYISPAGGIGSSYFVDGGYFDNSGAGAAHETLLEFERYLNAKDSAFLDKIEFNVIHIANSAPSTEDLSSVNPLVNDLAAPLLVLAASYGQQTEINTLRFRNYIIEKEGHGKENWVQVNLYSGKENERPYSMSWYMSDECRKRINDRFNEELEEGALKKIIDDYNE